MKRHFVFPPFVTITTILLFLMNMAPIHAEGTRGVTEDTIRIGVIADMKEETHPCYSMDEAC